MKNYTITVNWNVYDVTVEEKGASNGFDGSSDLHSNPSLIGTGLRPLGRTSTYLFYLERHVMRPRVRS